MKKLVKSSLYLHEWYIHAERKGNLTKLYHVEPVHQKYFDFDCFPVLKVDVPFIVIHVTMSNYSM